MEPCLLPDKVEQFKRDLKDRTLDIKVLMDSKMTSEARTAIFAKYTNPEDAKIINTLFEKKLVLKNQMLGIENLFSKIGKIGKYSAQRQAELKQTLSEFRAAQQRRIFNPTEQESFYNDLASKIVKNHVTLDQAQHIYELAKKVDEALKTTTPNSSGVSIEYLKATNEFNKYVDNLNPVSALSSTVQNLAIIGRNHLLMNPATPIKTTLNQAVNFVLEGVSRRLAFASTKSASFSLARQINKDAWKTFRATGNNILAMEGMDDTRLLGTGKGIYKQENFQVPSGATKGFHPIEKTVRNYAKLTNLIAIKIEHNISFTKFYQKTWVSTANIIAGSVAKTEGLKGAERKARAIAILKDAARIEPETKEGIMVRNFAQKQAARVTSTNDTWASELAIAGKNALNNIIPGAHLGDLLVPIAKIPSNIVANSILNSGVGAPKAVYDIIKGRFKLRSDNFDTKYEGLGQYSHGILRLMAIFGTLAVAALLTKDLKKSDFRTDQYGAHYVLIGNTWINTEYFSILSAALGGMMQMKEDGKGSSYLKGVAQSGLALPVSGAEAITTILKTGIIKSAGGFISSRGVPAFVSKLSNPQQLLFGVHGVESTQQVTADKKASADKAAATRKANAATKPRVVRVSKNR